MPDKTNTALLKKYGVFVEYACNIDEIEVTGFGSIDRHGLANTIIFFDLVISVVFLMSTVMQGSWIERETAEHDVQHVDMPDFAVRIHKLPSIKTHDQLEILSAALTLHIDKIVKGE